MARFKTSPIPARFKELSDKKTGYVDRAQTYANWTLPHLFPDSYASGTNTTDHSYASGTNTTDHSYEELDGSWTSIGARCVNHLANKYMMTLFPPSRPFFRSDVPDRVYDALMKQTGDSRAVVEFAFARMEREAGLAQFERIFARPALLEAIKLLIITGNALVYIPTNGRRVQVYSLYDYVVLRDASGEVIEIITVDYKDKTTLTKALRDELDKDHRFTAKKKDGTYKVYTRIRLKSRNGEKRYHVTQSIENFIVKGESWVKPENMRWFPLVWSRTRRENYGRGLVEENSGNFHAADVLSMALAEGVVAASDIKYLVNPNSGIDVYELTHSDPGTYHYGESDSVKQIDVNNPRVWEFLMNRLDHYERELGLVFLLNTAATREAERVTAQEIRIQAQELETSHGGVYSTLAMELQYPLASLLLKEVDDGDIQRYGVKPMVITGMEALGRSADLDATVRWLETLGLLQNVPEEFRAALKARDFAVATATGYGVDYSKFIQTKEEVAAAQDQATQTSLLNATAQGGIDGVSKMVGNMDPKEAAKMLDAIKQMQQGK